MMPPKGSPSGFGVLRAALVCTLLACSGGAERARQADSTSVLAAPSDSLGSPTSLASDATLVMQVTPAFVDVLRAVTDSFATREAVRVVLAPHGDSTNMDTTTLVIAPGADLVVVTGRLLPRLPNDSTSWWLPFAESVADTVALAADSTRRVDSASRRSRTRRRATGRRADSMRADSVRRTVLQRDSVRAVSARAVSARTLVLTIPANAPNHGVAERFVRYLLTDGRVTLLQAGVRVLPRLVVHGTGTPPGIRAVVDTVVPRDSADAIDARPRQ